MPLNKKWFTECWKGPLEDMSIEEYRRIHNYVMNLSDLQEAENFLDKCPYGMIRYHLFEKIESLKNQ